jgi:hypothetical protein
LAFATNASARAFDSETISFSVAGGALTAPDEQPAANATTASNNQTQ